MGRRGKRWKPTPRRAPDPGLALKIARAQLRAVRAAVGQYTSATATFDGARDVQERRFIHAWSVQRGMSGITQALDSAGQIWERHTTAKKVDGAWVVEAEWWEPIGMERREPAIRKEEAAP